MLPTKNGSLWPSSLMANQTTSFVSNFFCEYLREVDLYLWYKICHFQASHHDQMENMTRHPWPLSHWTMFSSKFLSIFCSIFSALILSLQTSQELLLFVACAPLHLKHFLYRRLMPNFQASFAWETPFLSVAAFTSLLVFWAFLPLPTFLSVVFLSWKLFKILYNMLLAVKYPLFWKMFNSSLFRYKTTPIYPTEWQ